MNHPDVLPHDPPKQIADDLFVVYGCIKMMPGVRISRNMAIVRDNGQLTLINPVRMDEAGLSALEALGDVAHVLRLGPFHGMDDGFYVERYQANFWSFTGGTTYTAPAVTHTLSDGGELPFARAQLLAFSAMKEQEGVILLERSEGGVLLTCDAIQSYSTPPHTPHTNWLSRTLLPVIGFPRKTLIGPFWLKLLVTDKARIQAEFRRLLELDFDALLAAHGTFVATGAHAEVEQAYAKMFG